MTLPTTRWRPLIAEACRYASPVPEDVLEAMVLIESGGEPNDQSVSDARGLTQIIPKWHADILGVKVAADLGVELTDALWYDPKFSLFAGARLLKGHYGECGSWTGAVRKYHSGSCTPPAGFIDGGGTSSDQHITRFVAALQQVRNDRYAAKEEEGTPMALKAYRFVGSNVDYWLPDDIAVEIAIVPAGVTNVRSNQFSLDQTTVTIHETANFNAGANADMHKRWLHGGAGGSSVGFNFVVDDRKIIQLTPLNEVTWAAGTPAGNRTSWHIESCVNSDADLNRTRRNTAALGGSILAAQGWAIGAMVQHNVWYGKNCPMVMRNNGLWPGFVKQADTFRTQSIAASQGSPVPAPAPVPAPLGKTITLRFDNYLRTSPGFYNYEKKEPNIVRELDAGTRGQLIDGPREADGVTWYDMKLPDGSTGWVQDEILHALSID